MHRGQRVDDPLGRVGVLDGVAQVLEVVLLLLEVRLEVPVGQHLIYVVVEPVGLHELVVEVERDREAVRHRAIREAQRPQYREVRRLDPEGVPVVETDVAQGGDRRDREIPLGRLGLGRPRRRIVGVHFRLRRRADRICAILHLIADVAADEIGDVGVGESIADVGVGNAVLHGAQVDVRTAASGARSR